MIRAGLLILTAWSLKQMFARRDSSGPTVDAPLLWGKVIPRAPGEPDPDFKGFGFRKIIQYHGWTSVDINSTRQALKRPPVEVTQATSKIPERQIYDGPTYTPGPGAEPGQYCRRRVVVETQSRAGEPRARGIITSYGRLFDL